jgi:hypothetical protein
MSLCGFLLKVCGGIAKTCTYGRLEELMIQYENIKGVVIK